MLKYTHLLFDDRLEGIILSRRSWLAALLACVFLVPGAYCIEVVLSAEYGEDYASIESGYDVGTGVSVSEESSASFDQPAIENVRSVSGTGDVNAFQSYSGSSGYFGQSDLYAYGVSGTFEGSTSLTPSSMSAGQSGSFAGDSTDAGMSLTSKGNSVAVSSGMTSGAIVTSQNIWTGSAEGGQDTQITGADSGYIDTRGYVIDDIEWTFVRNEITLGEDGKPSGDLIIYQTVSADGTVIISVDWLPCV
jgi:hypothetical protein